MFVALTRGGEAGGVEGREGLRLAPTNRCQGLLGVAHHFFCDKLPQLTSLGMEGFRAACLWPGVAVIHADQLAVLLPRI